jgi:hypothetical protein
MAETLSKAIIPLIETGPSGFLRFSTLAFTSIRPNISQHPKLRNMPENLQLPTTSYNYRMNLARVGDPRNDNNS